jgi:hypothetical protein
VSTLFLDSDPMTGRVRYFHTLPDGRFAIETRDPSVRAIAEANHEIRKTYDERTPFRDTDRVASVPMALWIEMRRRGIAQDKKSMRKWLNDPDNRIWRTRPGEV